MDSWTLFLAATAIGLGGFLKGATGAAAPVVGVPILAVLFDVQKAVAIFSVINLFSNVWQAWAYRTEISDRRFVLRFAGAGAVGVVAGSVLLATLPTEVLLAALAVFVFAYIGLRLARPDWRLSRETARTAGTWAGFAGGVMQGGGGISAPASLTFLNAMRLERPEFIGTVSVFFLAMSLLQIPTLAALGILTAERFWLGVIAMAPLFAGMWVGARFARRLSKEAFDRVILVLLAVIALKLVWDAIV